MQRLTLRWNADSPRGEVELVLFVDDVDLVEVLRIAELPAATEEGAPTLAGSYAGLPAWRLRAGVVGHFLGGPDSHLFCGPRDKTVLLGCNCGEPGCWPLMANVDATSRDVRWSDFEQPHRSGRWSYEGLGPIVFDRRDYERALAEAEATIPPDGRGIRWS